MEKIKEQLEQMGYDYAVAIATKSEIENGALVASYLSSLRQSDNKFDSIDSFNSASSVCEDMACLHGGVLHNVEMAATPVRVAL